MTECLEFSQYVVLRKYGAANSSAVAAHEGLLRCALSPLILRLSILQRKKLGLGKLNGFSRPHDCQNGNSKRKPDIPTPKIFLLGTKNSPQGSDGQHFRSEIKIVSFYLITLSLSVDIFKSLIIQEEIKYCSWLGKAYNLIERDFTQKMINIFSTKISI